MVHLGRITACLSFLRPWLDEICHHLDYSLPHLEESFPLVRILPYEWILTRGNQALFTNMVLAGTNATDRRITMYVTLVYVQVNPGNVGQFIEATRRNHEASVLEPGNRRFDVLQMQGGQDRFVLYEAYADAKSAAAHKEASHYVEWRAAVADWMAVPRHGVTYHGLYPLG
jgi:autoinducer 2-degrading protein